MAEKIFPTELRIDGESDPYRVLNSSYSFYMDADPTGRPTGVIKGGTLSFEIEGTKDTKFFDSLGIKKNGLKGSLVYRDGGDLDVEMKEVTFDNAFISEYSESYSDTGSTPITESFTLSAEVIGIGGSSVDKQWS